MGKEENIYITPTSEAISVPQIRQLMELGSVLNRVLTNDEFVQIAAVYKNAMDRVLKESEDGQKENRHE